MLCGGGLTTEGVVQRDPEGSGTTGPCWGGHPQRRRSRILSLLLLILLPPLLNPLPRRAARIHGRARRLQQRRRHEADERGEGVAACWGRQEQGWRGGCPGGAAACLGNTRPLTPFLRALQQEQAPRVRSAHMALRATMVMEAALMSWLCMSLNSWTARSHWPPFSQALMSEVKM